MKNALALVAILSLAAACAPAKHEERGAESGRTYTVRGQVTQLPDPAHPGSGLYLSHEAVDSFVDRDAEPPVAITRIRKLPPDTKLSFRAAKPPTPSPSQSQ